MSSTISEKMEETKKMMEKKGTFMQAVSNLTQEVALTYDCSPESERLLIFNACKRAFTLLCSRCKPAYMLELIYLNWMGQPLDNLLVWIVRTRPMADALFSRTRPFVSCMTWALLHVNLQIWLLWKLRPRDRLQNINYSVCRQSLC